MSKGIVRARRSRTWGVLDQVDGVNLTGNHYKSEAAALRARDRLRAAHPGACITFTPSADDLRLWRKTNISRRRLDVVFYQVCLDFGKAGGGVRVLAPRHRLVREARRRVRDIQRTYPQAYLTRSTVFFRPGEDEERQALMDTIK